MAQPRACIHRRATAGMRSGSHGYEAATPPLLMALSPDRRQVAYGVPGAGGRIDLIIRRVAGGPLRRVNNARTSGFASWGPRP